ncbi:MAG: hypothetical protein IKU29_07875 [Parabacteroides sp.]|nr:hypothetical protein [Parabacteroides sp.]
MNNNTNEMKNKKTYQVYSAFADSFIEVSAEEMTDEEFDAIKNKKDTPEFVHIVGTDRLMYNEHTCLHGYDGTCRCISHPRKSWITWSLKDRTWVY